ncbi:hypothetical protein [Streptomyces sp. SAI-041]|uniref:hypothetical protein n=1 Tax=Streptomyces sp. SAI-041 TaxID=2940548 RepID=UPI002476483C|nr:hypothetical protein [Streptomyces sp. SAI-041]MDH6549827.1 hypothetical protein [Streptomyces sp. SAI-041]
MATEDLAPGTIATRAEVKALYGGGIQGGIQTPSNGETVLIYSDPTAGAKHGYTFDGQVEDDEHGPLFLYTGEGVSGNQQMTHGNKALLDSVTDGRQVLLFVAAGKKGAKGGIPHRFVGPALVDPVLPYVERHAPGGDKAMRRVFVFRLRPVPGVEWSLTDADMAMPATVSSVVELPASPKAPAPPATQKAKQTGVKDKKTEKHSTKSTTATIQGGERQVIRREGQLVTAFEKHLTTAGHVFKSFQITVKGEVGALVPDLYDSTDNVLYEAKGQASRNAVRFAIGQLLDYRRHLDVPGGLRLAVLLPEAPSEDVQELLHAENIALVTRTSEGFAGFPLTA